MSGNKNSCTNCRLGTVCTIKKQFDTAVVNSDLMIIQRYNQKTGRADARIFRVIAEDCGLYDVCREGEQ